MNSIEALLDELGRIDPAELLLSKLDRKTRQEDLSRYRLEILDGETFDPLKADALLKEQLAVGSLIGFGCEGMESGVIAAGALVAYLRETQKGFPPHIKEIITYHMGEFMVSGRIHLHPSGAAENHSGSIRQGIIVSNSGSIGHSHGQPPTKELDLLSPGAYRPYSTTAGRGCLVKG